MGSEVDGYKLILDDEDKAERCTETDKKVVEKKALSLSYALMNALEDMPRLRWSDCCRDASNELLRRRLANVAGSSIEDWYVKFRKGGMKLCNPRGPLPLNAEKQTVPPLFEDYPDLFRAFRRHGEDNLRDLSSVLMHSFVLNTIRISIKEGRAVDMSRDKDDYLAPVVTEPPVSDEDLKIKYNITTWSEETVRRWMKAAGFGYKPRGKTFYTDKHEEPKNKKYRYDFTERYLKRELHMYRWVQVSRRTSEQLVSDGFVSETKGYKYTQTVNFRGPNDQLWSTVASLARSADQKPDQLIDQLSIPITQLLVLVIHSRNSRGLELPFSQKEAHKHHVLPPAMSLLATRPATCAALCHLCARSAWITPRMLSRA